MGAEWALHRLLSGVAIDSAAGAAAFVAACLLLRPLIGWLRRKALLDRPNERSSHSIPTPRGGGLAVTAVVLAVWAVGAGWQGPPAAWWMILIAALLTLFSWRDDVGGLPVRLRLGAHFAAAIAGIALLPEGALIAQGWLPWWADRLVALLALVWFINLYNFMDGIDGITGTEAAAIGIGIVALSLTNGQGAETEAAAIAGAALGFLVFNWHPAKIFLGDVGSVPLGFLIGMLLLTEAAHGQWAAALILPAYYLADATITLARRAQAGEKVWQAHRTHFYQRALRNGAPHSAVVRRIAFANLLLIGLALLSIDHQIVALAGAALVVAGLLTWLVRMGRVVPP